MPSASSSSSVLAAPGSSKLPRSTAFWLDEGEKLCRNHLSTARPLHICKPTVRMRPSASSLSTLNPCSFRSTAVCSSSCKVSASESFVPILSKQSHVVLSCSFCSASLAHTDCRLRNFSSWIIFGVDAVTGGLSGSWSNCATSRLCSSRFQRRCSMTASCTRTGLPNLRSAASAALYVPSDCKHFTKFSNTPGCRRRSSSPRT
mmetsp:Transcript_88593/g.206139  ORF Transcript_88593/g.206139 Transcript_88593/m.206139 type:complete len:203 (-) Transcript_88593:88-696(-)